MMLKSAACLIVIGFLVGMPAGANEPSSVNYYTLGGSRADFGYSIEPTSDGGYIVAGITLSLGNGYGDAWLIKLDHSGEFEWERVYGGAQMEEARHAIQTSDGGYLITGKTCSYSNSEFSDLWLIKTDDQGNPQWFRTFGEDNGEELGSFVQQTSDGGYVVVGRSNSFGLGDYDIYLLKTNALGHMQWQRVLGGNGDDFGYTVRQLDNGYAVAGYTDSFGAGMEDVCLIMTNNLGQQVSVDTYGGPAADYGGFLTQTMDGGYIISGESHSCGSGGSAWLVKTDADGNELWTFYCGGLYHEGSYGVIQTFDRGYLIAGWTETDDPGNCDAVIVKLDFAGNEDWRCLYDLNAEDVGLGLQQDSEGNCFMVGYTFNGPTQNYDMFVARLRESSEAGVIPIEEELLQIYELSEIYPNPGNGSAVIPFSLPVAEQVLISMYDCRGRLVRRLADGFYATGTYQVVLDAAGLSSGTYIIQLQTESCVKAAHYTLIK